MITILYAAILGFMYLGLTIYVVRGRWKYKIGLGDGGNPAMLKRIRMHGNFAEYVPFTLLLLFLTDYVQYSPLLIHVLGILLVLSRVCHIVGIYSSSSFSWARAMGVVLTFVIILVCSVLLLWHFLALQMTSI